MFLCFDLCCLPHTPWTDIQSPALSLLGLSSYVLNLSHINCSPSGVVLCIQELRFIFQSISSLHLESLVVYFISEMNADWISKSLQVLDLGFLLLNHVTLSNLRPMNLLASPFRAKCISPPYYMNLRSLFSYSELFAHHKKHSTFYKFLWSLRR